MSPSAGALFEIVDTLEGFVVPRRRARTLDGSMPLRATQGCVPLLEGNAAGIQVVLRVPWRASRHLGRWRLEPLGTTATWAGWGPEPESRPVVDPLRTERTHRGVVPMLSAQGLVPARGEWPERLARPLLAIEQSLLGRSAVVQLQTGWLVRPLGEGHWLRVTSNANRRNRGFEVRETVYPDFEQLVPLVLELTLRDDVDEVRLEGEVATLSLVPARSTIEPVALEGAPDIGRAHLSFYDRPYFDTKRRGEVTRKYRRQLRPDAPAPMSAGSRFVEAGPTSWSVESFARCALADGIGASVPDRFGRSARITLYNAVGFTARFDGQTVALEWDRPALAARAQAIEARWRALYATELDAGAQGALWYLTKYFTPHPPGEPHFFVKPCGLMQTPPGWSSWIEGVHGPGYDVLRGVVQTDWFHAVPVVFALWSASNAVQVAAGTPLAHALPLPRSLLEPSFELHPLRERCSA